MSWATLNVPRRSVTRVAAPLLALLLHLPLASSGAEAGPRSVSFRNEVMAVLSKAGCNAGPCHGNQNGKASFKLSLRGEDPARDHRALTRDMLARRVDLLTPDDSLLLLKATTALAHEGGQRFKRDSDEYALLQAWIAAGAPDDGDTAPALTGLTVAMLTPKPSRRRLWTARPATSRAWRSTSRPSRRCGFRTTAS